MFCMGKPFIGIEIPQLYLNILDGCCNRTSLTSCSCHVIGNIPSRWGSWDGEICKFMVALAGDCATGDDRSGFGSGFGSAVHLGLLEVGQINF